nr:ribonuclease H-like domain-containing protein [Tanacetum cinerariifolium]
MRLLGCPVTILNTKDHLGKFNGKADEGFFVGYSLNSKAFRVFNSRTRIVEEKLHIRFSENTPNVVGSRPNWLFDIDALTRTMNYEPIVAGTQSNGFAVYQLDVKSAFLYGKIKEEVYVCQPPGFEDLNFPDRVYKVEKALYGLHQALRAWSMIGSLMYLTSSKPDIMFAVCASARYQVNPKVSHLHVVKRIFRYLKGQPKLSLWYLKDSLLDLVAYTDSDNAGTSLDRKSTIGGKAKKNVRLMKDKIFEIELELILLLKINAARVDGKEIIITESSVRRDLRLADEDGVDCLSNSTIFENLELICPKTTAWNELSSTIASAIICLATNQKFNFSKLIFDSMIRNLDNASGKFLMYPRVDSFKDEPNLGEDASKQGRIEAIDADEDITLVNDQDAEMFDVTDLHSEEVFVEKDANKEVNDKVQKFVEEVVEDINTTKLIIDAAHVNDVGEINAASIATTISTAATITTEEFTLAKALAELKASKPKVKGVFKQDPSESITTTIISLKKSQDKGKGIMVEEPMKSKKKEQIRLDEEVALKLQAEFKEEQRLAREKAQKELEAIIALIETWDDVQAKIDADYQLAERLQAKEQQELTDEEKAIMFMQLLEKRRKFFARKDLKNKSFDSIQKMFDKAFKRVNTFEPISSELVKGSLKRAREEIEQERSKKQRVDDDKETAKLKRLMEIIPNKEEVAIYAIPLAVKSLKIVD